MREILFRGKRKDNGKWVEGSYCQKKTAHYEGREVVEDVKHLIITSMTDCRYLYAEVDQETVCQYTGLTDRNGRKIFEGDILRFVNYINNNEWLCVIEFLEGSFICRYIREDGELGEYNHFTSWHEKVKWEVISNIFDSPELVNQEEK